MKFSVKFTTVSFLAAAALGAGALAFGGCTVTSGTVDEDGGPPVTPTGGDSGSDAAPAATCEGNKQQGDLVSAACQACLNAKCCTELKGCFNANITANQQGGTQTCQEYATCISTCITKSTASDQALCYEDCQALAAQDIPSDYEAIITCAQQNGCETACNLQPPPEVDAGNTDASDASDQ